MLLAIVVGTLLSAALFALALRLEGERELRAIERAGRIRAAAVRTALQEYVRILEAMQAFWNASVEVKRAEFADFVQPLLNRPSAPLRALEWVAVVPADQVPKYVESMRVEVPGFSVHDVAAAHGEVEGERPLRYPVQFVEPRAGNEPALGLDLGSEKRRRDCLREAEARRVVRSSVPIELYQDPEDEGLILALAVDHVTSLLPGDAKEERLAGFVLAVVEIDRALNTIVSGLEAEDARLHIALDSGGKTLREVSFDLAALHGSQLTPSARRLSDGAPYIERFDLAGLTWSVQFEAGPTFAEQRAYRFGWILLLGGLSLTALLAAVVHLRENRARDLLVANRRLADSQIEREQVHSALRSSEERFRLFFECNTSAMLLVDQDSNAIVDANPAAEAFWGHTRAELRRMELGDLEPPAGSESGGHAHQPGGARVVLQRVAGGALRTVEIHSSPIEYQGRQLLFSIVHDVSDREAMQRKLLASQKMESLGALAGGIAHDFNNLLTSVIGNAELAQHLLPPGSPARAHLELSLGASSRAAELTRRLLAYAGKASYERAPMDLGEEVREAIARIRPGAPPDVALELELADALPQVEGDRLQLQQVVMNLVLNSIEACKEGVGRVRVRTALAPELPSDGHAGTALEAANEGPQVLLEVVDDGCGMDDATRARIFDPFFSTKFTGRGLGLPAVLGIVRAHRGLLSVESAPGAGTTFRIWLPSAAGALPGTPRPARAGALGRVLVVDDEPTVRDVLASLLGALGYQVDCAASGEEAIETCGAHHELVVLDVTMPGMGGRAALRALRERWPGVPVLLTSGYDEQETLHGLGPHGPDGFLQKPFTARVLAAQVEAVRARRSAAARKGGA